MSPWRKEDEQKIIVKPKFKKDRVYKFHVKSGNYPQTLIDTLLARGNWSEVPEEQAVEKANFLFRPRNFGPRGYKKVNARNEFLEDILIYNHFEVLRDICTKSGLKRSLERYYKNNLDAKKHNQTVFDAMPTTFLVSVHQPDADLQPFIKRFKDLAKGNPCSERIPMKHCQENIWLVKPQNMNQGRGIEIFKNWRDIKEFILQQPISTGTWVIQKYIEKPLLYN